MDSLGSVVLPDVRAVKSLGSMVLHHVRTVYSLNMCIICLDLTNLPKCVPIVSVGTVYLFSN